jgi:hypothetical protein
MYTLVVGKIIKLQREKIDMAILRGHGYNEWTWLY